MAASLDCVAIITNHQLMDAALACADPRAPVGARWSTRSTTQQRADELIALGIDGIVTDAVDCLGPQDPQASGLNSANHVGLLDAAHA